MAFPGLYTIFRRGIPVAKQPDWVKFWFPPKENPLTPEALTPTVVQTRELLNGLTLPMFDGTPVDFFTLSDPTDPLLASGTYPGPTVRLNRGQIFHGDVQGKGGSHTIHWHGIEPTPMNDGVGHTSMEVGQYLYQWQPNFAGTYFHHCHKNTVLHFHMGLFGYMIFDPPTGQGRAACNLAGFPQFPNFQTGTVDTIRTDPNAFTVPYDNEYFWGIHDVDPLWHTLGHDDFMAGFVGGLPAPTINGPFTTDGFLHDFNPSYFTITGVNVPATLGGTGTLPVDAAGVRTPDGTGVQLSDGTWVTGDTPVAVNAGTQKTLLIRTLIGAYLRIKISLPMECVVIAQDGRALGVPPFGSYNYAFLQPANKFFELTTARRWDLLVRTPNTTFNGFATVQYLHYTDGRLLCTAKIPFNVI